MDKLISPIPRAGAIPKAQGPLGQAAAMFFKNRGAVIGLALLVLIITASLAGPFLLRADPFDVAGAPMTPPRAAIGRRPWAASCPAPKLGWVSTPVLPPSDAT